MSKSATNKQGRIAYLLGVRGRVLGRELHLARSTLGEVEDTFLGTLGDGAVELRDARAGKVDVVLLNGVL